MIKAGNVVTPLYTTYRPAGVPLQVSGFVVEQVLPFGLMRLRGISPLVHQSDFVVVSESCVPSKSDDDRGWLLAAMLIAFVAGYGLGAMLF